MADPRPVEDASPNVPIAPGKGRMVGGEDSPGSPAEPSMLTLLRDCLRYVEEADRRVPGGSGPWLIEALRQAIASWETPGSLYGPPPESPVSPGGPCGCRTERVRGPTQGGCDIPDRILYCRIHAAAEDTARNLAELEREWDALQARLVEVEAERNALRERIRLMELHHAQDLEQIQQLRAALARDSPTGPAPKGGG